DEGCGIIVDIVKCKRCGKIFQKLSDRAICPGCIQAVEDDFLSVKRRVQEHPGENVQRLSQSTGVDRNLIVEFIREGRLQVDPALVPQDFYSACRRCGERSLHKRFCERCLKELSDRLAGREIHPKSDPSSRDMAQKFHFRNFLQDEDKD
ncbi:MAG TPA: hypothetical protein VLH40_05240, partial [Atribacteraceae bacterium]|nr:hypothetical protein [Atribacteraceae bacterium]